jgi:hypothetical protein
MHSCCRWTGACRLTSRPPGPVARTQHQDTPDVAQFCSKRAFDGQIRAWRRYLHTWDDKPPKNPPAHVGGGDDQASFVARGSGGAAAAGGGGAGVVAAAAAPALDYVSDSDEEQPSSTAATAAPLGGDDQAAGAEAAGAGGGGELLGCFVLDVVGSHGGGAAGAAPLREWGWPEAAAAPQESAAAPQESEAPRRHPRGSEAVRCRRRGSGQQVAWHRLEAQPEQRRRRRRGPSALPPRLAPHSRWWLAAASPSTLRTITTAMPATNKIMPR